MKFRAYLDHNMMQHLWESWYSSELFELVNIEMKGIVQEGKKVFEVTVSTDHREYAEMLGQIFHENGKVFGKNWGLNLQPAV